MNFCEAMMALKGGTSVRRKDWVGDHRWEIRDTSMYLVLTEENGLDATLSVFLLVSDLHAEWELFQKPMFIGEAVQHLRAGRKIRRRTWHKSAFFSSENLCFEIHGTDLMADDWEVMDESQG